MAVNAVAIQIHTNMHATRTLYGLFPTPPEITSMPLCLVNYLYSHLTTLSFCCFPKNHYLQVDMQGMVRHET
jgi:hypothetical protein